MRITKVYTRVGDKGSTHLVGGREVSKDSARIEGYGTVDELNAIVGLTRVELQRSPAPGEAVDLLDSRLDQIQHELFNLGSDLATLAADRWEGMRLVGQAEIDRLEAEIDDMNAVLPPLREFILPGGGPVSAFLHQARTVCRRAERRTVTLSGLEEVNPAAIKYLNRLSDWLFVAGRWVAKSMSEPEFLWDRTR